MGEPLHLGADLEKYANTVRDAHRDLDPRAGSVLEFIEREVPEDWIDWPTDKRLLFWRGYVNESVKTVQRTTISALEIWTELYAQPLARLTKHEAAEINKILKAAPGWEKKSAGRVGPERKMAKYYSRKNAAARL